MNHHSYTASMQVLTGVLSMTTITYPFDLFEIKSISKSMIDRNNTSSNDIRKKMKFLEEVGEFSQAYLAYSSSNEKVRLKRNIKFIDLIEELVDMILVFSDLIVRNKNISLPIYNTIFNIENFQNINLNDSHVFETLSYSTQIVSNIETSNDGLIILVYEKLLTLIFSMLHIKNYNNDESISIFNEMMKSKLQKWSSYNK